MTSASTRWSGERKKGVVLVTLRGRPGRTTLCAAFLHAGLSEPLQETRGLVVVTAGRSVKLR